MFSFIKRSLVQCASKCSTTKKCSAFEFDEQIKMCNVGKKDKLIFSYSANSIFLHINKDDTTIKGSTYNPRNSIIYSGSLTGPRGSKELSMQWFILLSRTTFCMMTWIESRCCSSIHSSLQV